LFVSAPFAETIDGSETKNKEIAAMIAKDFLPVIFMPKF
jgi:hypothetical protein